MQWSSHRGRAPLPPLRTPKPLLRRENASVETRDTTYSPVVSDAWVAGDTSADGDGSTFLNGAARPCGRSSSVPLSCPAHSPRWCQRHQLRSEHGRDKVRGISGAPTKLLDYGNGSNDSRSALYSGDQIQRSASEAKLIGANQTAAKKTRRGIDGARPAQGWRSRRLRRDEDAILLWSTSEDV
jgi:hypothetical protein